MYLNVNPYTKLASAVIQCFLKQKPFMRDGIMYRVAKIKKVGPKENEKLNVTLRNW